MLLKKIAGALCAGIAFLSLVGCTKLGALNALLPKDDATREVLTGIPYGAFPRQQLDLYLPGIAAEENSVRPVVVFLYGGAWDSGSRGEYSFVGHALNSKGYLAVVPDYRLVPQVRYPDFVLDSARAVEWVSSNIGRYVGDPRRIFVVGHSAGAYNAMMVGLAQRLLRENNIQIPRLAGLGGLAGPYDFLPIKFPSTRAAFEGVTDLLPTQPVNLVEADSPSLFLAIGLDDQRVAPKHSYNLRRIAEQHGVDAELMTYEEIGHAQLLLSLSKPFRKWSPVLDDLALFIDRQGGAVLQE